MPWGMTLTAPMKQVLLCLATITVAGLLQFVLA